MKKTLSILFIFVLLACLLSGCGQKASRAAGSKADVYYEMSEADYEMEAAIAFSADSASGSNSAMRSASIELPQNRKWVITMSLNTETEDMDAALIAVSEQISALGGYVESQNVRNGSQSSYYRSRSASLTVRIPADRVDSFVEEVGSITNMVSNSRNVQDITLAYSDSEGRVASLKTEETRLLELMAKAEDMSDLLEIEARLTEVRYQLESYASQLRLYDNQVDYATVDLYINEVKKYTPVEEPGFWQRITDGLSESIVDLGEIIVGFIAGVIIDLPYLVVLGLIGWVAFVLIRRAVRKHKAKKEAK